MTDRLAKFWLSLHASARRVDADQALLGALGVAAFAYPHQVDNVAEMVTDTTCRFLLADEVGLGKTIQALMVMRALGAQRETGLRVALVTPDDLNHQWVEELLCRTHVGSDGVPVEPDAETPAPAPKRGRIAVELFRPARLSAGAVRLNARYYDLLVVDEYTKLSQQMRDLVGTASRTIPHVLLLSATPAMHEEAMRRDLLAILEPDLARRAEASGEDLLDLLTAREAEALACLSGESPEPPGLETPPGAARDFYTQTHGLFRRVIRTRRADYPDALPQRRYRPIIVAPTDGDADRIDEARRYLAAATADGVNVRAENLLQTALASPQALINRASTLKRQTPAMASAHRRLDAAARDPGDAKLEALIDHLRSTFAQAPEARVLVVADDNRSVDDVAGAIEKLVEVPVARKRRAYGGSDVEMHDHVAQLREEIQAFESGEAKVLVAADVAAEGHNFQFASELIFYVLPWRPQDVDQWIGRLDRLGGRGKPGKRTIRITPIVTANSIEARMLEVYEAADIFSGARVFDEEAWRTLAEAIEAAAYGADGQWQALARAQGAKARGEEGWRAYSRLNRANRATKAQDRFEALSDCAYALPMSFSDLARPPTWFAARELAAKRLLTLAHALRILQMHKRVDDETRQPYRTLWYPQRPEPGDIIVPELDTESSRRHAALLLRRGDLRSPPNPKVDAGRRLHFFDHGDPLHDSVVDTFAALPWKGGTETEYLVRFADDHPGAAYRGQRVVLLTANLALAPEVGFDDVELAERAAGGDSQFEREVFEASRRRAYEAYLSDARWFRDLAPPEFCVLAATAEPDPEMIDPNLFIGADAELDLPETTASRLASVADKALAERAKSVLVEQVRERFRREIDHRRRRLEAEAPLRQFKTRMEAREALGAARAIEAAGLARGGTLAFDRARRRANELAVLLAEVSGEMREHGLATFAATFQAPSMSHRTLVLKVQ